MQPLVIDFAGKKVVIAGGGRIAARKAKVLEAEQAEITFIAPDFSEEVLELSRKKGYALIERKVQPSDFDGAILVILATNDRNVNGTIAKMLPPNQLVCVVDESGDGNVTFPATVRRGHLQIAVTSNGSSPKLTRKLKKDLEEQFDDSWETYTAFLAQCRETIKKLSISSGEKNELLWELLDERFRTDFQAQSDKLAQLQHLGQHEEIKKM
ncbi:precorrin-2 dehydrogenase/sirohydrochlorin ferrochelatase family protein [Bacillus sp. T33-2]|uniref:precorrin-2 dehydrogenase/sirohydrochlorin ferrochelatase family protein n=1 Tax=Bacillus sp. T33-2 TaxID=2054168 RepID=UPI000C77F91A|nr:NAD(P)-dependent oxidoreductase [Bacillus sp. T33-2]PLR94872.1 potassium transporter Trk [Bacillus sp. T33-2]